MQLATAMLMGVLIVFVLVVSTDRVPPPLVIPRLDSPFDILQGILENTGNDFDIAIQGHGYFPLKCSDGSPAYTRHGRFHTNQVGQLIDSAGRFLDLPIVIPIDTTSVTIEERGTVLVTTASNPSQQVILGNIQLVRFRRPQGLKLVDHRTYVTSTASGLPVIGKPGIHGYGQLNQGFVELETR